MGKSRLEDIEDGEPQLLLLEKHQLRCRVVWQDRIVEAMATTANTRQTIPTLNSILAIP